MTLPTRDDLIDFVYHEARVIDEGRFDEWLELWGSDSYYWMPLDYQQDNPKNMTSLMYEDAFLRKLRVERLNGLRTFSQKPKSRCSHVLNRPSIEAFDPKAGQFITRTAVHYVETRLDDQFLLAATVHHHFEMAEDELKIKLKRVDLLNCDAAFGNIQLFI